MRNDSISIIIPAYNEEKNLIHAASKAVKVATSLLLDYEIIIIDDGSTDKTLNVAKRLSETNTRIRVFRFKTNKGIGSALAYGFKYAKKAYVMGYPGDYDTSEQLLTDLIKQRKDADIISSYMLNPQVRSYTRRFISSCYVMLINLLFNLNLRYYNGYFIAKTKNIQAIGISSNGFGIFAEIKIRFINQGKSIKEIPFKHIGRKHGVSKAITLGSFLDILIIICTLFYEIRILKK